MRDTVSLPIPPSANQLWRSARTSDGVKVYKSKEYSQWLEVAVMLCKMGLDKRTEPAEIKLHVIGGKGWRKNRDLGNIEKASTDCLKHAGVIADDNTDYVQKTILVYSRPAMKTDEARLIVSIKDYDGCP